jgi:hydrogenase maturation protein HypF
VRQTCAQRLRVRVRGAVQGVGFRPFVHGLATRYDLAGYVLNDGEGVLLEVEGEGADAFVKALEREPPPLARVETLDVTAVRPTGGCGFEIRDSVASAVRTRIVPDAAVCDDCLHELFDPASRFYLYPFTTCTHCGPRFTVTRELPYDRPQTSMTGFQMCAACARDYQDPAGRRFHAETIACPACGPHLSHSVATIAEALRSGQIVALKGIGGFHLMCDGRSERAVAELRRRKRREAKPFAIMVADEAAAEQFAAPSPAERRLLALRARPIVVMRRRQALAPSVAPGLDRIGVMLPYAPVHHLLFAALPHCPALVATSANAGGEPLAVDNEDAQQRLAGIADLIVTHDRSIVARADDSVMAFIDGAPAYIRRSRGFVPEPIDLGEDGPAVLCLGGHLKATLTLTRGREAFVSQHIGDLDNAETIRFYQDTARRLLDVLDVVPEAVACDCHPDFHSTRFAETLGLPLLRVQHHAAHLASVAAEHRLTGPILGVALDGYGMGDDGEAWGGELMLVESARWRRLGHLAPLALPGGDRAAREPWRMAVAALAALDRLQEAAQLFPEQSLAGPLARALLGPVTTARTSSMGRLFDAAAGLLGMRLRQSYEGQAATEMEALVREPRELPGGYRIEHGMLDFRPLLAALIDLRGDFPAGAELFHGTIVAGLAEWAGAAASELGLTKVALGGGCFMNRVLAEGLSSALHGRGLTPLLPRALPANDGGLSLGQAALARASLTAPGGGASLNRKDGSCASPFPFA